MKNVSAACCLVLLNALVVSWCIAAEPLLDLNSATESQLASQLPGIGPAKAALIVQFRNTHGAFTRVEQLQQVKGIGPKTLEKLRTLVSVGSAAATQSNLKQHEIEDSSKTAFRRIIRSANASAQPQSINTSPQRAWYQQSLLEIMRTH